MSVCTCVCVGCHQWGVSFPETLANRLHPKTVAFDYLFTAGFCITVSLMVVKLSTHRILSLTPASVIQQVDCLPFTVRGRRDMGLSSLTGHLPVSSLNLTFRNLVILKLGKCDFLLEAECLQMRPNVEGCEKVTFTKAVLLS